MASVDPSSADELEDRLLADIAATVPGASGAVVDVGSTSTSVHARVQFEWLPPGPRLLPVEVRVERSMALAIRP